MPTHDPAFTKDLHGEPPAVPPRGDGPPRPPPSSGGALPRGAMIVALAGALLGAAFAALSTSDFMQHLDRQVHAIHCSFIPGAAKEIAESGCRTVMMSPYSSFFREQLWGGVPVSLWALAVFAFLAYRTALVLWRGETSRAETAVLLAAAALPVAMSVLFGALAVWKLDALCKVCVGIYGASLVGFAGVLLAHRALGRSGDAPRLVPALAEGVALVAALTAAYVALAPRPDPKVSMLGCGSLVRADDTAGVMIPLGARQGGTPSIEVLDPLCPSCKAFDARLEASSVGGRLDLRAVLFPLDSRCNWMVTEDIHPGACAVSEAILCAAGVGGAQKNAGAAQAVVRWAFANQADLRALAASDEHALRSRIEQQFPAVKGCLGGALVRSKLTKSLRWAVANALPVLTPQLFVADSRVCDEDTDLGLEYTLARMLSPEAEAERARVRAARPPPRPAPVQPVALAAPAAPAAREPVDPVPSAEPVRDATVPGASVRPEPVEGRTATPSVPADAAAAPAPEPAPEPAAPAAEETKR